MAAIVHAGKQEAKEGGEVFLFGRVNRDKKGRWTMGNPEYEIAHDDAESYIHIDRIAREWADAVRDACHPAGSGP